MSQSWHPPLDWRTRPVCVLGGGILGRRIASCFVATGHHVRIRDPSAKARNEAFIYIETNITSFTALSGRKSGTFEVLEGFADAVKDCWLVIEAVPEVLSLKEDVFAELEEQAPKDCILASNSSSYKSGDLLKKTTDETKKRVLNAHFIRPPEAMYVEVMTSGSTADGVIPFFVERLEEAGLRPIVVATESTGFVFNRIWAAIKREILLMLAEGVSSPEVIDEIWVGLLSGSKLGPCKSMDMIGLDTVANIEEHYIEERHLPREHMDWLRDNYISPGKLGEKCDKGGLYPPTAPGK